MENNKCTVAGRIATKFILSHEINNEKFYFMSLEVERLSGAVDTLKVLVSETIIDAHEDFTGLNVEIDGEFRSYNEHNGDENHLILYVFAEEINFSANILSINSIQLRGYLCKHPIYRKTPLGREITDLLIAVNRPYSKSDYLPCVCWGRNARFASKLIVGDAVSITGRLQSREYIKDGHRKTAYEVSVTKITKEP